MHYLNMNPQDNVCRYSLPPPPPSPFLENIKIEEKRRKLPNINTKFKITIKNYSFTLNTLGWSLKYPEQPKRNFVNVSCLPSTHTHTHKPRNIRGVVIILTTSSQSCRVPLLRGLGFVLHWMISVLQLIMPMLLGMQQFQFHSWR
jgi:hypothetical protein